MQSQIAQQVFNQPFTQVTLPILIGFFIAVWNQSRAIERGFNAIDKRFDDMGRRLDRIDDDHEKRFLRIEAETSPMR